LKRNLLIAYESFLDGLLSVFVVESLESGVEIKKVDAQGRLILPADWRQSEIDESRELYIIKRKGYLKLIPKRRVDLTECFDKVDLRVKSIGSWSEFEKKFSEDSI
jgi:bifunctional DNA-binding transcriptional regulator/antitoxin component of YhaV-PrlF toxin-antitoxin module